MDGTVQTFEGKRVTLEEAQAFVGGFVEIAHVLGDDNVRCQMLVNENGIAEGLEPNAQGTIAYRRYPMIIERPTNHVIVGNVIFLYGRCKWK